MRKEEAANCYGRYANIYVDGLNILRSICRPQACHMCQRSCRYTRPIIQSWINERQFHFRAVSHYSIQGRSKGKGFPLQVALGVPGG